MTQPQYNLPLDSILTELLWITRFPPRELCESPPYQSHRTLLVFSHRLSVDISSSYAFMGQYFSSFRYSGTRGFRESFAKWAFDLVAFRSNGGFAALRNFLEILKKSSFRKQFLGIRTSEHRRRIETFSVLPPLETWSWVRPWKQRFDRFASQKWVNVSCDVLEAQCRSRTQVSEMAERLLVYVVECGFSPARRNQMCARHIAQVSHRSLVFTYYESIRILIIHFFISVLNWRV